MNLDFEDEKTFRLLVKIAREVHADPCFPAQAVHYFKGLLVAFSQSGEAPDALEGWLRNRVHTDFRWIQDPPEWVQGHHWVYHQHRPLVFAGQLRIPAGAGLYHDEAELFVFVSPDGSCDPVVVTQVY